MTCEQFRDRMMEALEGGLSEVEARQWMAHQSVCATCRAIWEAVLETDARLRAIPMTSSPPDLPLRISRRIRRYGWWERWGAMGVFIAIGLGIAALWAEPLWSLRGWLEDLWSWIPSLSLVFWDLIRLPIASRVLIALLGAAVVLTMGLWASMKGISRMQYSR